MPHDPIRPPGGPTPLPGRQPLEQGAPAPRAPATLIVAVSAWIALACNLPLWRSLQQIGALDGPRGWLLGGVLAVAIAALLCALLSLFAWRATLKPMLSLLLLAAAVGAHFMLSYGVVIDSAMIVNALQTDAHETRDLLGSSFALTLLALAGPPLLLVWRTRLDYGRWPRRLLGNGLLLLGAGLAIAAALWIGFQPLASTMRNHKQVRYLINPISSLYALGRVAAAPLRHPRPIALTPIGADARLGASYGAQARPPLLVLVLGETGRSGNFGLNGYARDTTPELARLGVSSLRNVWSCGTSTAASVPCMFSHLGRDRFEARERDYEGLLDVLQHAGLAVLWIDNQAGCKGVCDRVPQVATTASADAELCRDGECLDGVMLRGLDERIAALPATQRARGVVVVMHQIGSHGPAYHKRSPGAFKRFLPECTSASLQDCSREQVVNAYDNTIAYTDHFLAETVHWLERHADRSDTALLYVADHGESLGENNLYLHGLPYALAPDVQKRVPWIGWLSPGFAQRRGLDQGCVQQLRDVRLTHDSYFHSVLGLLDVQTGVYQPALDAYAACSAAAAAVAAAH
jgi:lipid A ethanolaminephosphotransferase